MACEFGRKAEHEELWLPGGPNDAPASVCLAITLYAEAIHDAMDVGLRARIRERARRLLESRTNDPEVMSKRAYVAADHAVRVFAPLALESAGRKADAARLRACARIADEATARMAKSAIAAH